MQTGKHLWALRVVKKLFFEFMGKEKFPMEAFDLGTAEMLSPSGRRKCFLPEAKMGV